MFAQNFWGHEYGALCMGDVQLEYRGHRGFLPLDLKIISGNPLHLTLPLLAPINKYYYIITIYNYYILLLLI